MVHMQTPAPPPCQRAYCSTRVWMTGGQAMGGVEQHHVLLCRFEVTMHRDRWQTPILLFPAGYLRLGRSNQAAKIPGLTPIPFPLSHTNLIRMADQRSIFSSLSSLSHRNCKWSARRLHIVSQVRCCCLVSCCTAPIHCPQCIFLFLGLLRSIFIAVMICARLIQTDS